MREEQTRRKWEFGGIRKERKGNMGRKIKTNKEGERGKTDREGEKRRERKKIGIFPAFRRSKLDSPKRKFDPRIAGYA